MRFLLFFFLIFNCALAQEGDILITKTTKFSSLYSDSEIKLNHVTKNNDLVIVRSYKKNYYLDVLDTDLNLISSNKVAELEKNSRPLTILSYEDKITLFYSNNRTSLVTYVLNINDNKLENRTLFTAQLKKKKDRMFPFQMATEDQDYFAISPNGKYIAISHKGYEKSDFNEIRVYDSNSYNLIYKRKYQILNKKEYYILKELIIDDNANVYSLGKIRNLSIISSSSKNKMFKHVLNRISKDEDEVKVLDLTIPHEVERLSQLKGILDDNSELMKIFGLYGSSNSNMVGVCAFEVDLKSMSIKKQLRNPFSKTLDNKEDNSVSIDYLFKGDLGSYYMIFEDRTLHNYQNPTSKRITVSKGYLDVFILKFDSDLNQIMSKKIDKSRGIFSYYSYFENNQVNVVILNKTE